MTIKIPVYS